MPDRVPTRPYKRIVANLSLVTINLLSGAPDWQKRLPLLIDGLKGISADVIACQEVTPAVEGSQAENPARRMAAELNYAHCLLTPQIGHSLGGEAVAILSRQPLLNQDWIDLGGQGRVAQRVTLEVAGQAVVVANTHLFWQPGDSPERLEQVEKIIDWLAAVPGRPPAIICGDFNSSPEMRAIRRMKREYLSAYATVYGREPEKTFPTPLKRSKLAMLLGVRSLLKYVRLQRVKLSLNSTLDYIFVDRRLRITDCRLALDRPDPHDPGLYPSDHYGLWARIEVPKG